MKILIIFLSALALLSNSHDAYADEDITANLSFTAGSMSLKNLLAGPSNLGVDAKPKERSRYFGLNFQAYLSDRFSILSSVGFANDFNWIEVPACPAVGPCEPRYFHRHPLKARYASIGIGYDILRIDEFALLLSARRTRNRLSYQLDDVSSNRIHKGNEFGAIIRWNANNQWFIDAEWTRFDFNGASRSARQYRTGIAIGYRL